MPDSALSIAELDAMLAEKNMPVRFCGDGYDVTLAGLQRTQAIGVSERLRYQSAYAVAQVARRMAEQGDVQDDVSLAPTYLRMPQAERERLEKLKNQ